MKIDFIEWLLFDSALCLFACLFVCTVWDVVDKSDTGCTAGSMAVFHDAGLIFKSSTTGETESRQGRHHQHSCNMNLYKAFLKRDIV